MKPGTFFTAQTLSVTMLSLLLLAARSYFAAADIDPQAVNHLKTWIAAEYTRYQLKRQDIDNEEKALLLQHTRHIEFVSVTALGPPQHTVFRITVAPNPAQPPNTPQIRYYRMSHDLLTGWSAVPQNVSALSYYLALFRL